MAGTPVTIFTLPTAVLGLGVQGPFVSPAVGAQYSGYSIQISHPVGWPGSGKVWDYLIERSVDGGVTWFAEVTGDCNGSAATSDFVKVNMGDQGPTNTTDLFRFTFTVAQACGAPVISMTGIP